MAIQQFAPLLQFASWRVPQLPGAIEYPLGIMEEIRAFCCDELLQLSHGGCEVGGVLFGTRREDLIRVLTWRPIACEHAHGESLLLSYNDRMNLAVQLELARQNADLKDLRPLGWFVSHLRDGVSLSASDLEVYNGFFPEAWQATLVICPQGDGRAEAGFFGREADGSVQAEASYYCFELKPSQTEASAPSDPAPEPQKATRRHPETAEQPQSQPTSQPKSQIKSQPKSQTKSQPGRPVPDPVPPANPHPPAPAVPTSSGFQAAAARMAPSPLPARDYSRLIQQADSEKTLAAETETPLTDFEAPSFQTEENLPAKERWLWAIPIALALGIAGFVLYQQHIPTANGLGLRAAAEGQTVQLAWDATSRAIRDSYRGEIEINDGGTSSKISLTGAQLHAGKMSYQLQSSDAAFDMTAYRSNGGPVQDSTRIIAPAFKPAVQPPPALPENPAPASPVASNPAPPPPAPAPDDSALEQQVQQLKQALAKESARADQLQNLVRILENRLSIQSTAPKSAK